MKRTFGQFKAAVKVQKNMGLTASERAILKAFNQGADAGRSDEQRRCPYMPSSEQEKSEAWFCGFDEHATKYVIASGTEAGTAETGTGSVHEGPTAESGDAQPSSSESH